MLFDRDRLPVIVVAWMGQPVEEVGCDGGIRSQVWAFLKIENGIVGYRQLPDSAEWIILPLDEAIVGVLRQARSPILTKPLCEGSALISPVLVIIAGRDDRAYPGEMRRMRDCGQHLSCTNVGAA